MKTVARNATRKIEGIKARVVRARSFSLSNNFTGPEVDQASAWEELGRYSFARLIDHEDGKYIVQVHGNLWYELYTASWQGGSST